MSGINYELTVTFSYIRKKPVSFELECYAGRDYIGMILEDESFLSQLSTISNGEELWKAIEATYNKNEAVYEKKSLSCSKEKKLRDIIDFSNFESIEFKERENDGYGNREKKKTITAKQNKRLAMGKPGAKDSQKVDTKRCEVCKKQKEHVRMVGNENCAAFVCEECLKQIDIVHDLRSFYIYSIEIIAEMEGDVDIKNLKKMPDEEVYCLYKDFYGEMQIND